MNLSQLRNLAKPYGCPIESAKYGARIYAPGYTSSEVVTHLENKQAKDIQPILAKLSGKKTAELWNGGKGGQA